MTARYKRFKLVQEMTPEELTSAKATQFDFDEKSLGAFVPIDDTWYTEVPLDCKPDVFPISFRNGGYRADAICDGFVDEKGYVYISEHEMDIGICIEWKL